MTEALEYSLGGGQRCGMGWGLCSVVPPGGHLLPSLHPFSEKLEEEMVKHEKWEHSVYLQEKRLCQKAWQERGLDWVLVGCPGEIFANEFEVKVQLNIN